MDENNKELNNPSASSGTSKGLFGETDRDSGEYRFKSGMTRQVYSNANFGDVNDFAEPPKYYRPASGEKSVKAKKKGSAGVALILVLCLFSAIVGGACAGVVTYKVLNKDNVEKNEDTAEEEVINSEGIAAEEGMIDMVDETELAAAEPTPIPNLLEKEIYDFACRQVVCITTDIVNVDIYGNKTPSIISGSGFIISEDGYIMTNYHVVEYAVNAGINVTVTLYDETVLLGTIVGADRYKDIAIVKVEKTGFMPVTIGDSDLISVGDTVYAVGNPYGMLEYTMSIGHISALHRIVATDEKEENASEMFQIDANVYSGNSGGPAYNSKGEVIGIVSAKYSTDGFEGIGFAIPINNCITVAAELLQKGYAGGKADLSASFDERYSVVYSRYYRLPEGAYVESVKVGGCAEKAGIKAGDIIMQIGDYTVSDYSDVSSVVSHFKPGENVGVILFREGIMYRTELSFDEYIPDFTADSPVAIIARAA